MGRRTYAVYIMASRSKTLYTGVTGDLEFRVYQHKKRVAPGFTSKYRIDRLVYYEVHGDARAAIAREKQVKAWTRAKRMALIESKNATWVDLAAEWEKKWERVEGKVREAKARANADFSLRSE